MPSDVIPGEVRGFIIENIDSIAQLEGLLLLRANPGMHMNAEEIAKRLYMQEVGEAREFLQALATVGFLETESGAYRYRPQSSELDQMVGKIADIYSRYLVPLTNLIHSKPSKVQKFADAFKIRKDRD